MTIVVTTERAYDRGSRRGARLLRAVGEEFREKRLVVGISQQIVAHGAAISQSWYSEVEAGTADGLTIVDSARIASVLGLDLSVRVYPGGSPLRDAAHSERLMRFLKHARTPLAYRFEVPLPALPDRPEQRAWDAVISGAGKRTAVELEMRLRDGQALERRMNLKRRDDPTEAFVLLVADTRTNRRVLAEHADLFGDLLRLRPSRVHAALTSGQHPPSGILLV
jgi:transcriptional regulator with XRE-family HTH domain